MKRCEDSYCFVTSEDRMGPEVPTRLFPLRFCFNVRMESPRFEVTSDVIGMAGEQGDSGCYHLHHIPHHQAEKARPSLLPTDFCAINDLSVKLGRSSETGFPSVLHERLLTF